MRDNGSKTYRVRQHFQSLVGLSLLIISGCIEPFDPAVADKDQGFLVVEGSITDHPGPHSVKITRVGALSGEEEPITVSNILIEGSEGDIEYLMEESIGVYITSGLQGIAGRKYQLRFKYEGDQYTSDWMTLRNSSILDSLYYKFDMIGETTGLQFYVDNHGIDDSSRYYRFEYEETWETSIFSRLLYEYQGNDSYTATTLKLPEVCWKENLFLGINLLSTERLSQNKMKGHKLAFIVGNDGEERFTVRYSILVSQFTITEDEYLFWNNVRESNDELGGLFDKQPASILSNINNVTTPLRKVLGYFSVSGLSQQRIFIEKPGNIDPSFFITCPPGVDIYKADFEFPYEYEEAIEVRLDDHYFKEFIYQGENGNIYGIDERDAYDNILPILGVSLWRNICIDCTAKGGKINQPEFW